MIEHHKFPNGANVVVKSTGQRGYIWCHDNSHLKNNVYIKERWGTNSEWFADSELELDVKVEKD